MVGQTRVEDTRRRRRGSRSIVDDRARVLAVAVHADAERLHAAEHEVAVERRRHRAHRVLQEPQLVGELGVVRRRRTRRRRRSDRRGTSCSSAPTRRRRARAVVAGTASRTCCRRRRARRACARASRPPRCRRSTSAGFVGVSIHTMRVASRPRAVDARRGRARSTARPVDAEAFVHARDEAERAAVRVGREDDVIAGRRACAAARPRRRARSRTRARGPRLRATRGTPRARARVGLPLRAYS